MVDENTHTHACTVCGKEETTKHIWDDGTVVRNATCLDTGELPRTCTGKGCGAQKTDTIPLADHTFSQWKKIDETAHGRSCTLCGLEESGTHCCDDALLHDENGHFQQCGVCDGQVNRQVHTPGPEPTETEDQVCTVCARVLRPNTRHVHEFAQTWSNDELGHWYGCIYCDEKRGFAVHAFENNCDSLCEVCRKERTAPHTPELRWSWDETGHWRRCADCGGKVGVTAHTPGDAATTATPQLCIDCGYEIAPVLSHDHAYDLHGSEHVHLCPCGESYRASAGNCEICRAEAREFPWWILCIAEAVVFGGVIGWLLLRGRNKKAEEATECVEA
jgi:hypothetical protein